MALNQEGRQRDFEISPHQRLAFLLDNSTGHPWVVDGVLLATLSMVPYPLGHLLLQLPSSQGSRQSPFNTSGRGGGGQELCGVGQRV